MSYLNSAGVKLNDNTDLIIEADPDGTVRNVFNRADNKSYTPKLLHSETFTISTTATTPTERATIDASAFFDDYTFLYVKIRDKAGHRTSHFYGCDSFIDKPEGVSLGLGVIPQIAIRVNSSDAVATLTSNRNGMYGVFVWNIDADKIIRIYSAYNSSSSGTIDGDFLVEIYGMTV